MAAKAKAAKRKGADSSTANETSSKKVKIASTCDASAVHSRGDQATVETHTKSSRKRASDLFEAVEDEQVEIRDGSGSRKKARRTQATHGEDGVVQSAVSTEVVASKKGKPVKSATVTATTTKAVNDFERFGSSDDENDTANLLAGFETSSDSGSDDAGDINGKDQGIPLSRLPRPPPASGKAVKAAEKRRAAAALDGKDTAAAAEEGTTLYIGHIPHGFYERQMHAYFSQFGDITRLRLARNKRTGAPKHYAFIEFASADVADIVQRTMDKYLLFNHILQVRKMSGAEVHADLWRGANRRFKVVPWGAIQARGLREPREREVWKRRVEREQGRRRKRGAALLEAYGYEFEGPELRSVDDVAERIGNGDKDNDDEAGSLVEAVVAKAIESGDAVPEEIVEANTLANWGEPLIASDAPADEVQLKKDEDTLEHQQQRTSKTKGRGAKPKRNVSAPIVSAGAEVQQEQPQKKSKTRGKGSKRTSI